MAGMAGNAIRFRAFALLTAAALSLHQLRYLLAYGGQSEQQLGLQAHAYLALIVPVAAVLMLVAVAAFAVRLLKAKRAAASEQGLPTGYKLWARSSCFLLGLYSLQEWLEGQLGHGHEAGVGAVFGHGGWWAIPLALALGAVVASLLRGAATAIELVAARRKRVRRRIAGSTPRTRRARGSQRPALDVVAAFLAGRGPPVTSS
jgi:hypothetical protein